MSLGKVLKCRVCIHSIGTAPSVDIMKLHWPILYRAYCGITWDTRETEDSGGSVGRRQSSCVSSIYGYMQYQVTEEEDGDSCFVAVSIFCTQQEGSGRSQLNHLPGIQSNISHAVDGLCMAIAPHPTIRVILCNFQTALSRSHRHLVRGLSRVHQVDVCSPRNQLQVTCKLTQRYKGRV